MGQNPNLGYARVVQIILKCSKLSVFRAAFFRDPIFLARMALEITLGTNFKHALVDTPICLLENRTKLGMWGYFWRLQVHPLYLYHTIFWG